MARIGVMTFLHNDNYGSTLQAWALQKAMTDMGHEAEHIDYRPNQAEKIRNLLLSGNSPRLILEGMRKRRANGSRPQGFRAFQGEQMKLSPACPDHRALARRAQAYDLLIAGSDQVWSPVWLNPAYFLDFTRKPKVAYACSLGVKEMPVPRKQRRMAALIKPFRAVSVREEAGADMVEKLTGSRPAVTPDPVMLVEKAQWQQIARNPAGEAKYILCYFIGEKSEYWKTVEDTALRLQLPVKVIPMTEAAWQSGYEKVQCAPQEWLGLISGAAYLITDSFHGATFAAILNRPFEVLRRYSEDDPESKNSRVEQMLSLLELPWKNENPDWERVNARLSGIRAEGLAWLEKAVTEAL